MLIDFSLIFIFVASALALWYKISLKIPELVAIQDQVITQRFHEDSARLRLFMLHLKTYYREGRYKPVFWNFIAKNLYRLHLVLMRLDNGTAALLKRVRAQIEDLETPISGQDRADYWQRVQNLESNSISSPKNKSLSEVRKRIN